jgi:glycine dehydrogenase
LVETGGNQPTSAVAGAPFGSGQILTISHAYIMMMGSQGLTLATKYAILNANYIAASLKGWFETLYCGSVGFVAHEMILDCRKFKAEAGITEGHFHSRFMGH